MKQTHALARVAQALMATPSARHWGYDLSKQSGVRSGVMYPLLQRMLDEGWLADGWEDQPRAGRTTRPSRRYYTVTGPGKVALTALLEAASTDPRFRGMFPQTTAEGSARVGLRVTDTAEEAGR